MERERRNAETTMENKKEERDKEEKEERDKEEEEERDKEEEEERELEEEGERDGEEEQERVRGEEEDEEEEAEEGDESRMEDASRSAVQTAAATDACNQDPNSLQYPLSLAWCFGFNHNIPVHNISTDARKMIFYVSGHTGIIFDCEANKQCLLQGHGNPITCTAVSGDRRWLVTADEGDDPILTVWDSFSGIPVRSFFEVSKTGCVAVAMSHDACYLATLSSGMPQTCSLWDWTEDTPHPLAQTTLSDHTHIPSATFDSTHHSNLTFDPTHHFSLTFDPTDHSQLVSTACSQVVFYCWDGKKLHNNSHQVSDKDFNRPVGLFSHSLFIPGTAQILSCTDSGLGLVWAPVKKSSMEKKLLKLMKISDHPITALTTTGGLIVVADNTGYIKFFSSELKILHCYDNMKGKGSIVSVSFGYSSHTKELKTEQEVKGHFYPVQSTLEPAMLVLPNFTTSTLTSSISHITTNGTIVDTLLRGQDAAVHAIAAHPTLPRLVIGGHSTRLQLWDYERKEVLMTRDFEEPNYIQCTSFDPRGEIIGVGFASGVVTILDSLTLQDTAPIFRYSRDSVTHISFSHNSQYMATTDLDNCVSLYKIQQLQQGVERGDRGGKGGDRGGGGGGKGGGEGGDGGGGGGEEVKEGSNEQAWQFLAKYRSHYKRIEAILFGVALDSDDPRLLSVGQDRMLVEYDVENTTADNLRLLSSERIEQTALPSSLIWYPPLSKESFLLLSNSQYKLKLLNSTTKMCRRTILGPTYGTPLRKLIILPSPVLLSEEGEERRRYAAFITSDKVGLLLLPHDGNPHNSQCLLAHPSGVRDMVCSHDGRYVFTAGGRDCSVNMWSVNTEALEAASQLGGRGLEPFYALLEGGRNGPFFSEIEDYFYYAQIRSQGPNTRDTRHTSTTVPCHQIPDLMRALSYYPSQQEIEDMLNEVKFSRYVETGSYVSDIDLGDFIRLYINHRPVFGLSPVDLVTAFQTLGTRDEAQGWTMGREELVAMLQENGEHMTEAEIVELLMTLLGRSEDPEKEGAYSSSPQHTLNQELPESISAAQFAEDLLQFSVTYSPS